MGQRAYVKVFHQLSHTYCMPRLIIIYFLQTPNLWLSIATYAKSTTHSSTVNFHEIYKVLKWPYCPAIGAKRQTAWGKELTPFRYIENSHDDLIQDVWIYFKNQAGQYEKKNK